MDCSIKFLTRLELNILRWKRIIGFVDIGAAKLAILLKSLK